MTGQAAGFLLVFGLVLVALAVAGTPDARPVQIRGPRAVRPVGGAAPGLRKAALLVSVLLGAYGVDQPPPSPLRPTAKKRSGRGSTASEGARSSHFLPEIAEEQFL
ncbi:MAG: hypothetical protein ACLR8Y_07830 [Alistipes indistinctus]